MIPGVQLLMALWAIVASAKFLGWFGVPAPSQQGATGHVYVTPDHPAAVAAGTTAPVVQPSSPAAPPAPGTANTTPAPSVKQIAADTVRNPWATWGVAALCLTAPLLIAQLRAAGHEVASGVGGVYNETQSVYRRVDEADNYVGNRSRAKRRK